MDLLKWGVVGWAREEGCIRTCCTPIVYEHEIHNHTVPAVIFNPACISVVGYIGYSMAQYGFRNSAYNDMNGFFMPLMYHRCADRLARFVKPCNSL